MATAIHAGHDVRSDIIDLLAVDDKTRLREEDPFTDYLTEIAPNRIIVTTSRFEFDLNRPLQKAIYLDRADAWGIDVWQQQPNLQILHTSLSRYEQFYQAAALFLNSIASTYRRFVVLDLHAYCHRRKGPEFPPDDPASNPDINIGTGSANKKKWAWLIERCIADLRAFDLGRQRLDVRENVKFQGGYFSSWINRRYPNEACAIAIEVKKIFMDEWTGQVDMAKLDMIKKALASAIPGILEALQIT